MNIPSETLQQNISSSLKCDAWLLVWVNFAVVDLDVCEYAGKVENHPGRWVSSHCCLEKVL